MHRFVPGVLLCVAVTGFAALVESVELRWFGQPYLETLVIAILLGALIRTAWSPGRTFQPGIDFSAKFLLEFAIWMLGASVDFSIVAAMGNGLLLGIIAIVTAALIAGYLIGRVLGLSQRMAILVACGNAICGNSAIAAVAPAIGATGRDIACSIAFTAVLGVIVVLGLPLLVPLLSMSERQYGVLAGLTVYAVPQVLAATLPVGSLSNQVGTIVKLVRVLLLGPVILAVTIFARTLPQDGARTSAPADDGARRRIAIHKILPWFILAFLVLSLMRSANLLPDAFIWFASKTANVLTLISMAALGLGVDIRMVAQAGPRVVAAVSLSLLALLGGSLVLIYAMRLA
ncbi:MAG: putative sulfate exporter family transporter [Beijerinckiaceae bacterium]|nr:putative sulfate exporter family transporter [Beijerinckiaceae bacterium]